MAMNKREQEEFDLLRRQRDDAGELLSKFLDDQTPSDFYSEHWLPTAKTSRVVRRFIQANEVALYFDGVTVEISKGQHGGVRVSFMADSGPGDAAIVPVASNVVNIVSLHS